MTIDQEADNLERIKKVLDTAWELAEDCIHPDTGDIVSNPEYDKIVQRLRDIRPNSKELSAPSSSQVVSDAKKVKHDPPLTSISKASGTLVERNDMLTDWLHKCSMELKYDPTNPGRRFTSAYKWDGLAVALYYEKGKLIRAGLRPRDGIEGEDVTENVKYVEGIKQTLPIPITCSIRGEIICKKSTFKRKNAELEAAGEKAFVNPRAYATGSIRQFKDPTVTKDRELSFCGYSIVGLNSPPYKNEIERAKWSNVTLGVPFVQVRPYRYEALREMEDNIKNLDYEVDGVVLSVSELEDCEQLGAHGNSPNGNPKGKLAWKFDDEQAQAKIASIELNVGRSGNVTPVLIFERPILLDGTSVTCCTGHNLGYLRANKIGIGTVITVIKSGKIIPKCVGVVSGATDWQPPTVCPACGSKLIVRAGNEPGKEALVCTNDFCGERAVSALVHYLATFGVKGLSDSTVAKLYEAKLVQTPADFYTLRVCDLNGKSGRLPDKGLGDRTSYLVVARIHMIDAPDKIKDEKQLSDAIEAAAKKKHQVPLWQFFAALGIPTAGKSAGRALESHFGGLAAIRQASVAQLESVDEVGTKTAQVVFDFLRKNAVMIDELLKYVEPVLPKVGKLTGVNFVFTGGFPDGKSFWTKKVEDLGGKCGNSVSAKTHFVVVGTDAGIKEEMADELGIPKLTLDELKKKL